MQETPAPSPGTSEVEDLRTDLAQLVSVLWLGLAGLLLVTVSLGVVLYRLDRQVYFQLNQQKPAVVEAQKKLPEIFAIVSELQKFGQTHPGYASNVLVRFNLAQPPPPAAKK